jgi:hypothetical protein
MLVLADTVKPNEEQARLLADGMENLVEVLGNVCSSLGKTKH